MDALLRLAGLGSEPLGAPVRDDRGAAPEILRPLFRAKNGFYAFEASLHVFAWGDTEGGGESWNDRGMWLKEYGDAVADLTFFAEDAFGFQFATDGTSILSFDPETAEREQVASDVDEWASCILDDLEFWTGFPVMHEWQSHNGPIMPGHRLAPAVPFILGGRFDAQEMRMKESVELMHFRADIYRQLKDLPEGMRIRIRADPTSDR